MNKFITEISEEDFKKLQLQGYDNKKINTDTDGYVTFDFVKCELNDKLEEYKHYLADLIQEGEKLPWTIALCIHTEPTEEAINYYASTFKDVATGKAMSREESFKQALYDFSYFDKWMDRSGHTTYEFGVGIDHLYSTRDKWVAHWIDYFEVRKRDTKAVYIIHLEGKPEDYFKNGTD